jgi:hypothetical protein
MQLEKVAVLRTGSTGQNRSFPTILLNEMILPNMSRLPSFLLASCEAEDVVCGRNGGNGSTVTGIRTQAICIR